MNEWKMVSPMPWKGVTVKCAAVGSIVYVLAGFQGVGRLGHILEYNTETDKWIANSKVRAFPVTSCLICVVDTCGANEETLETWRPVEYAEKFFKDLGEDGHWYFASMFYWILLYRVIGKTEMQSYCITWIFVMPILLSVLRWGCVLRIHVTSSFKRTLCAALSKKIDPTQLFRRTQTIW